MDNAKVLEIVLREMTAIGRGWRYSWADFDGRALRDQLNGIATFAESALASSEPIDYTNGTDFEKEQLEQ